MKTLLAGPDCSVEFGWLVAVWVPLVRARAKQFDQTIVICRDTHEPLYEFADAFEHDNRTGQQDRWLLNGKKINPRPAIVRRYRHATLCRPRPGKITNWQKNYKKYGYTTPDNRYDVVVHARHIKRYDGAKRNWPLKNYRRLVEHFDGKRICSIGTMTGALHVPSTEDLRGIPLDNLMDVLASSQVCVGTSSGPMHLAAFCGCPHVVFSDGEYKKSIGGTNKKRYKKLWNPFRTPCKVLDAHNWQPPVGLVERAVRKYVEA